MVVLTLLYGCETWTVQRRHVGKLQAFKMMCLRRVQGLTRIDRVRNEEVREALAQEAVIEIVKEKQRKWKAELKQMRDNRLVKIVYEKEAKGKRPRGNPKKDDTRISLLMLNDSMTVYSMHTYLSIWDPTVWNLKFGI